MKNYLFAILVFFLVAGVVTSPIYATTTPGAQSIAAKNAYLKTLKVPPPSNPYLHTPNTNVKFPQSSLPKPSTSSAGQTNIKAQGNLVAGQPWGSSTVVAQQATQAHNTQNSKQAQNAQQATQAQQAHEPQPTHQTSSTPLKLPTNQKFPAPTLPSTIKYPTPKLPGH
ncbi:MAG: hypothetical protein KGI28_03090 [Thaumarchaeota archaeon]|nr:hypothetical protein [Nitrososphaerota archaeon]